MVEKNHSPQAVAHICSAGNDHSNSPQTYTRRCALSGEQGCFRATYNSRRRLLVEPSNTKTNNFNFNYFFATRQV